MTTRGKTSFFAALAVAAFATQTASAATEQDAINEAAARELAGLCKKSLEAQNFQDAVDQCSRADNLYPSKQKPPALLVYLARACRGLGKLVCAHQAYDRVAKSQLSPDLSEAARKAQESLIEEGRRERLLVAEKLAHVTIVVPKAVPGVKVTLDDVEIQPAAFGVKLPLDPGKHSVEGTAKDHAPFESKFEVAEKEEKAVTVTLIATQREPDAPKETGWSTGRHAAVWTSYGLALAGLVVGTIGTVNWVSKNNYLKEKCQLPRTDGKIGCPDPIDNVPFATHEASLIARGITGGVGFAVAGIGIAVGTIFVLTAPKAEPPAKAVSVKPQFGFGTIGINGTF